MAITNSLQPISPVTTVQGSENACQNDRIRDVVLSGDTKSLADQEEEAVQSVINAVDKEELEKQLALFNMNQTKKNVLRISKLDKVLDKVENQLLERIETRPDQVSTKELIDVMNSVSNQISNSNDFIDTIVAKPQNTSKITNKTEITVNMGPVDREGKERVMDVVTQLLKQARTQSESQAHLPDTIQQNFNDNTDINMNDKNCIIDENESEEN